MDTSRSEIQSLAARIETLEKQNRLLKRAGLILLFLPGILIIMGQARPSRTFEAESFVLRDTQGKTRASLLMQSDGPRLTLYDPKGTVQATFGSTARGPVFELEDSNGNPRISLKVANYAADELTRGGARIQGLAMPGWAVRETDLIDTYPEYGFGPTTGAELDFLDEKGGIKAMLSDQFGRATLGLSSGEAGDGTILLTAHKDGPSVRLYDGGGYKTFIGTTGLVTPTTGETHKTSAASVNLFDKEGHSIWSAPSR